MFRAMLVTPSPTVTRVSRESALQCPRKLQHGSDSPTCEISFSLQFYIITNDNNFRAACCVHQGSLYEPGSNIENDFDGCEQVNIALKSALHIPNQVTLSCRLNDDNVPSMVHDIDSSGCCSNVPDNIMVQTHDMTQTAVSKHSPHFPSGHTGDNRDSGGG